jgi:glycerol-3-phosphate dehydrogenase
LFYDGASAPQQATRNYVLKLEAPPDAAALLSVFGGKITTYRRLAEAALAMLQPHLPPTTGESAGWTGRQPLPGGDFAIDGFNAQLAAAVARFPFIPQRTLHRLLRAYGTRIDRLLGDATCQADLGHVFGADLTAAELHYLVRSEWARTAEDVVWRRSKLGLRLSAEQIVAIDDAMRRLMLQDVAAA